MERKICQKLNVMKKILLFICCIFIMVPALAQHELWGTVSNNGLYDLGYIFKTDANGNNPQVVYHFEQGSPLLKPTFSDGILYGVASAESDFIYQYDTRTNQFMVLYETGEVQLGIRSGLTEVAPKVFYGVTVDGAMYFKYDANTNVFQTFYVPGFYGGTFNQQQPNNLSGVFLKASDGYLYGTTTSYSQCPIGSPRLGAIARINLADNSFLLPFAFNCTVHDGFSAIGQLIQVGNKLYGLTNAGGSMTQLPVNFGEGVLFEYDITTNTFIKKAEFNNRNGSQPTAGLTLANDGKLYGTTFSGGTPYNTGHSNFPNGSGVLFKYDPATETITTQHEFRVYDENGQFMPLGANPSTPLVKAANGKLYGINRGTLSLFEYNVTTSTMRACSNLPATHSVGYISLTEICRPPSYRIFNNTPLTLCAGTPIAYNLHTDNSTTIEWRKNGQITNLTTAVLEFEAITTADAGVWEATLTNACGVTHTPAITLNVNPATASTVTSGIPTTGNVVMLCPGTTLTLLGNDHNGVWNTGVTTPTLEVTEAGEYRITNTNSCGNTYSNIVTVQMYELPEVIIKDNEYESTSPDIYVTPLCVGAPITFYGNTHGGIWQDGSAGETFTTTIALNTDYFVTTPHPCGPLRSNVIRFTADDMWEDDLRPVLTPLTPLDMCGGQTVVTLSTNRPENSRHYWTIFKDGIQYLTVNNLNREILTLEEPGTYVLERTSFCFGSFTSAPITITESNEPPPLPVITVNGELTDFITLCNEESVVLTSSAATGNIWSNGETTQSITVSESGLYNVMVTNGCGTNYSNYLTTLSLLPDVAINITENNMLTVNEANATYQWLQCSIATIPPVEIAGATAQSFIPIQDGLYAVRVTNQQGCTATSQCFAFGTMGINPNDAAKNIILYPNPAKEKITLQTSAIIEKITIINMLGQTVASATNATEVDTSSLAHGQYILIAQTDSGTWRGKFVKN